MHSFQVSLVSKELSNHQEDVGKGEEQASQNKVWFFSKRFRNGGGRGGRGGAQPGIVNNNSSWVFHRLQASSLEFVLSELIKNIREVI